LNVLSVGGCKKNRKGTHHREEEKKESVCVGEGK